MQKTQIPIQLLIPYLNHLCHCTDSVVYQVNPKHLFYAVKSMSDQSKSSVLEDNAISE